MSRRRKSRRRSRRSKSRSSVPKNVVDKALYHRVRNKVKRRVKKWPSAYASGQVVVEYKRRGGRYRSTSKFAFRGNLGRWFAEEWVDVCTGKPCGRKSSRRSRRKYPYCRPKRRISSKTPRTAGSLSPAQKKKLCVRKRRSPSRKMKSLRRRSRWHKSGHVNSNY